MYNLFSSSPQRWDILKQYLPVSLHNSISKIRWSAWIDSVNPVVHHLISLRQALCELESFNLTSLPRTELNSIQEYSNVESMDQLLRMIHQTNMIIEARDTTLDDERDNIKSLTDDIQEIREQLNES